MKKTEFRLLNEDTNEIITSGRTISDFDSLVNQMVTLYNEKGVNYLLETNDQRATYEGMGEERYTGEEK